MPSHHQFASRLAAGVVQDQLGDINETTIKALLSNGMQSLGELRHSTGLPLPQLKQSLLALIQQNCVNSYLDRKEAGWRGGPGRAEYLYEADLSAILHNLRKPRIAAYTAEELGEVPDKVVDALLLHGRLTFQHIVEAAASSAGGGSSNDVEASVASCVMMLMNEKLLERAPGCDAPVPEPQVHENARKRAGKAAKEREQLAVRASLLSTTGYEKVRFKPPEELASIAATGAKRKRPSSQSEQPSSPTPVTAVRAAGGRQVLVDSDAEEEEPVEGTAPAVEQGDGNAAMERDQAAEDGEADEAPTPAKRQRTAKGAAPGAAQPRHKGDGQRPPQQLWSPSTLACKVVFRINYGEFDRRFRHEVITDYVETKFGAEVAAVMAALLEASRHKQYKVQQSEVVVTLDEVRAKIEQKRLPKRYRDQLPDDVDAALQTLYDDPLGFVEPSEGMAEQQVTVAMERMVELEQLRRVETSVRSKFGQQGLRVFRVLFRHQQLEQKSLADLTMLPLKETRELLYRMLNSGYVAMQDIPKGADHAASRTFYTWSADFAAARARVALELYQAACNVRERLNFEVQRDIKVIKAVEEEPDKAAQAAKYRMHRGTIERVTRTASVLGYALVELDQEIALFSDM